MEIIPAILPRDYFELEQNVESVKDFVKSIQVDVCDGGFVPNVTWPYKKKDDNFEKLLNEECGLPFWDKLDYEFDLMVNHPEEVVEDWVKVGATRIVVHVETFQTRDIAEKTFEKIGNMVEVGLAIDIDTPIDEIAKYIDKIKFVQCMGIDNDGFQGQDFDNKVLDKIAKIKQLHPHIVISVDGGVNIDNAHSLKEAGASRLIIGSAIFNSENIPETIKDFKNI